MIYKNKNFIIIILIIIIIVSITTIVTKMDSVNKINKNYGANQTEIELNQALNADTTVEIMTNIDNIQIYDLDNEAMNQIDQELQNL
jgi:uncharacterized protein (UPF0333 family)